MKTINTAAYAAVAATTSNGRFTVASVIVPLNTPTNPVMILSLVSLLLTYSSHHMGASSIASPTSIIPVFVKHSKVVLLEYDVASEIW